MSFPLALGGNLIRISCSFLRSLRPLRLYAFVRSPSTLRSQGIPIYRDSLPLKSLWSLRAASIPGTRGDESSLFYPYQSVLSVPIRVPLYPKVSSFLNRKLAVGAINYVIFASAVSLGGSTDNNQLNNIEKQNRQLCISRHYRFLS